MPHIRVDERCLARAVDAGNRSARFLAQSPALASDNLIILPYAGRKRNKEFMKNPIVVPYHMRFADDGAPIVIGNVKATEFTDEGMFQDVRYAETELAEQWWVLVRDGFVKMCSIAWARDDVRETDPAKMLTLLKKHGITLKDEEVNRLRGVVTEYRQKDLSMVAIGSDPKAMQRCADEGNEVAERILEAYEYDEERGLFLEPEPEPELEPEEEPRVFVDLGSEAFKTAVREIVKEEQTVEPEGDSGEQAEEEPAHSDDTYGELLTMTEDQLGRQESQAPSLPESLLDTAQEALKRGEQEK